MKNDLFERVLIQLQPELAQEFGCAILEDKKKLQALESIKEKVMPLVDLDYEPERKGREYRVYDNELYLYTDLTQEEYELLKEVLL